MSAMTRRKFLRDAGIGAGAVVWGCYVSPSGLLAREHLPEIIHYGVPLGKNNFFVSIVPIEGTIVITTHRAEMGQGIRCSLAAVLADELEADWSRVRLRQANADSDKYAIEFPYEVKEEMPFPYNPSTIHQPMPKYLIPVEGSQFTDRSRSMTAYFKPMRLFGAGVRLAFEQAAAKVFGVDPGQCRARQHKVYAGDRSIDYGDLRLLFHANKLPPAKYEEIDAALKDPKDWVFIHGAKRPMPFNDALDMVTGKPIYGADQAPRGMLTAVIERCPVANGRIASFDPAPALAVPGVRKVMRVLPASVPPGGVGQRFLPHDGVAVIADNTWAALQGRRALRPTIVCDYPDDLAKANAEYDSRAFRQTLKDSTAASGMLVRKKADLSDADFADSANVLEAEYYVPHLAQAPMEPPVATALYQSGTMEVWAPTQNPELAQQDVGRVLYDLRWDYDLDEGTIQRIRKAVTLHMPLLGGGFGRKSKPDYIVEAAFLAKQNPGVPIRVQWTREDDIKFSYYNAASSQYLKAAVDGKKTNALLQRSAFTSFFGTIFPESRAKARAELFNGGIYPYGSAIERAQGLEDMPFDVPKLRIENCPAKNYIRVGWMRSVANIYHAFASGSFADELAVKKGDDPKDHLLGLIGDGRILSLPEEAVPEFNNNGLPVKIINLPVEGGKILPMVPGYPPDTRRLRAVVKKVAEVSGWDDKVKLYKGTRRGLGIAAHRSFLSYVATVIDVSLSQANELTIHDVYTVVDCGLAVNPDRVSAQMEGAVVYGLSLALFGEITVKKGAVEQNNFDDYPVLRIYQAPKNISVTIMEDEETPPTGIGEVGVPTVAPALANAIVAAGGPRIREMPICRQIVVL